MEGLRQMQVEWFLASPDLSMLLNVMFGVAFVVTDLSMLLHVMFGQSFVDLNIVFIDLSILLTDLG